MDKIIFLALIFSLASCGGSGGGNAEAPQPNPAPIAVVSLSGHAVKGPLANALFSAFEFNNTSASLIGAEPFAQASSDAQSRISNLEVSATIATPFIIEVSADVATDLSTNALPILTTLRTVVTQDMLESSQAIFPNPLTTIALEVARINADSNNGMFIGNNDSEISADEFTAALPIATKIVAQALGFGIPAQTNLFSEPPLVTASTATIQQLGRVAIYRTAIETTTALILELQQAAGPNPPTADALLMGLASDLADGRIDGVYNGNSIEVFSNIVDIAAVLSIDQSLLLIPGTLVPVLDVKLEVAAETELTGFSEVDITALTNGEIEVSPGRINLEPDSDLDGTLDVIDTAIDNPCIPEVFVSACAQDSDGDGATDFSESALSDSDGDGVPDYAESLITDTDNDGLNDQADANNNDACLPLPFNASCLQDSDGDGATDFSESALSDSDGDGAPDYLESSTVDTDIDGLSDQFDSNNTDACLPSAFNANCSQDSDGDGSTDFTEGATVDSDGDGELDYLESSIVDVDIDGLNNQLDSDNTDACLPSTFNASCSQDSDADGISDFNEGASVDSDGDGIFDFMESLLVDLDSDGSNNQVDRENSNACVPEVFNAACTQDSDGDGDSDFNEGVATDSDGDTLLDYLESSLLDDDADGIDNQADIENTDACIPSAFNASCNLDTDSDGLSDFTEGELIDSDTDGLFDYQESFLLDTDFDGTDDQNDLANGDPCLPNMTSAACNPGIAIRPVNTSCVATASGPGASGRISLQRRFPNITFNLPVKAIPDPGGDYWFVVEQSGTLRRIENSDTATNSERYATFDVRHWPETGFLGLAFAPGWPDQKEFYVSYNIRNPELLSRVSRFVITDDSVLPATYTEEIILEIDQPGSNHNGGDIAFGSDGYLYFGLGDGGSSQNTSQNTANLLGSMLRIDVNNVPYPSPGYQIPSDNPFALNNKCGPADNIQNCPEIYAWGFRNPWRWSFDSQTNNLWLGDVGQDQWEEVDTVVAGGNYGWPCREGANDFNTTGCASTGLIDPVYEYAHAQGNLSITGGYVYRGTSLNALAGRYVFADYLSGRIWSLSGNPSAGYQSDELIDTNHLISSFAQDAQGELYITSYVSGEIYQLIDDGGQTGAAPVPADLADTGCVATSDPHLPASGLIPYQPEARFWSDGAEKQRWLALPDNTFINASNDTVWEYPSGTVAMKNFLIENRLIETRLFMRHMDGAWAGYTYEWDDSEATATRVVGGKTRTLTLAQSTQEWIYPSEDECMQCHTAASGFVLGLNTPQLNGEFLYPESGITDNQLETFNHINMFSNDVPEPVSILPFITDPNNLGESIEARAKAYLHTNCASCHQPGGGAPVNMDLRFETPLGQMNICNVAPQLSDLGILDAKLIAPGEPASSIILNRMNRRDNEAMPPIGSALIDSDGVALLTQWVNQLACN